VSVCVCVCACVCVCEREREREKEGEKEKSVLSKYAITCLAKVMYDRLYLTKYGAFV
jgi:hypothetical protein